MNYIVISKKENFKAGAKKIQMEALKQNKRCEIIEIGNILNKKIIWKINKENSLIYFLTNNASVPICVKFLKTAGIKIVNEAGLSKSLLKFSLQQRMRKHKVCIPKSIMLSNNKKINDFNEIQYPFFIKSQKQADMVVH